MLGLFIVQVTTTAEICRSCRCKSHENVDCKTNLATARGGQHNDARACRRWLQHASQLFPSYAAKGCNKCKNFWKKGATWWDSQQHFVAICTRRPILSFYHTFLGTDGLCVLFSAGYKCICSLYFPLVFAQYCMCYVIIAGQLISPHVLALFCFTSYRLNHVLSIGIKHTTAASYLSS